MLHNETGLSLFGAANDVVLLDDVWMIEHFLDHVFSLNLFGLDWEDHFDGDFSSVFFIVAFEDVWVFASAEFLGNGVIFDLTEYK